jgi:3-dehydroquinate synthetase
MDNNLTKEQYTETLNLIRSEVDRQLKPLSNQLDRYISNQNDINKTMMDAINEISEQLKEIKFKSSWQQSLISFGGGFCAVMLGFIIERFF